MLKKLAIDVLLRWAFRVELPKGHPVERTPWELMFAKAGELIASDGRGGGGFGVVPGDPHADALALASIVRKLTRAYRLGADRVARLCGDYAALEPPAIAAVGVAPFNLAALVIRGAVLKAFEWDIGEPTPQPMRRDVSRAPIVFGTDGRNGELVVAAHDAKSKRYPAYLTALHCPVMWLDPSVAELAETRAEFAAWHDALLMVRDAARLADHEALPPSVAAMPWRHADEPAPKVRPIGDHDAPRTILPLAPRRAPTPAPLRFRRKRGGKQTRIAKTA